jgi:hypothetical protein
MIEKKFEALDQYTKQLQHQATQQHEAQHECSSATPSSTSSSSSNGNISDSRNNHIHNGHKHNNEIQEHASTCDSSVDATLQPQQFTLSEEHLEDVFQMTSVLAVASSAARQRGTTSSLSNTSLSPMQYLLSPDAFDTLSTGETESDEYVRACERVSQCTDSIAWLDGGVVQVQTSGVVHRNGSRAGGRKKELEPATPKPRYPNECGSRN